MMVKKNYKVGDKVRVVSYSRKCCHSCDEAAEYFEKHKPIGTITYVGSHSADIDFDKPQDIHRNGGLIDEWTA
jgi:D-arabinose 1-dehydrogenase-like Zn-dependent alcohol dehydrogenase